MKKLISFLNSEGYVVTQINSSHVEIKFTDRIVVFAYYECSGTYKYFVFDLDDNLILESNQYKKLENVYYDFQITVSN